MQNSPLTIEQEEKIGQRAEELFRSGYNCCESMIKSSVEIFELPLPENIHLMGRFFRQGIAKSGCVCGALAGGIMMLGLLCGEDKRGLNLAEEFRNHFVKRFGSTCCRVLRKNESLLDKINHKQCRNITKFSAATLYTLINDGSRELTRR